MRSLCVVAFMAAACGSVSSKEDAGVDTVPPGSANIALAKMTEWVAQGDSTNIDFTITRGSSVTGPLTVHIANLPTGVTAADVAVAAGATTGTITFAATTTATVGATTSVDVALSDGAMMLDHRPFDVFVAGAHGTLDTTYGTAGMLTVPLPDPNNTGTGNGTARAVTQYPASAGANAGKLLVALQMDTTGTATTTKKIAIVRVNTNGTIDTTFNTFGYTLITAASSDQFLPGGIAIDSQSRILVSARRFATGGTCNFYVTRLTAAGAVDSTYSIYDGAPPQGYCGYTGNIAAIAGDKHIVVGFWNMSDGAVRPTFLQFNENGGLDTTFGSGGEARLPNPDTTKPSVLPNRLFVDSQGRYLLTGAKCNGGYNVTYSACESFVGRITAAGAWDTTFGAAGAGHLGYSSLTFGTTAASPQMQGFSGLAFDATGNIVTVGWAENYATATLAKYSGTDGALDTTFGTSGRLQPVLVSGGTVQELDDVGFDSQGRIVGIGYAAAGGPLAVTTRYSAGGAIDTTFGTAGVGTATAGALQTLGTLQADGRILVVGATLRGGTGSDLAIWRFWP